MRAEQSGAETTSENAARATNRSSAVDVGRAHDSSIGDDSDRPMISVRDLRVTFERNDGTSVPAVDGIDLDVYRGELVILLGPSGCGKTTLLRVVAGLQAAETGSVSIDGRTVFDSERGIRVPAEKRDGGMIFQSYALWPHMTAYENVGFPLKTRRLPRGVIKDKVNSALEMVGIPELAGQRPNNMSGGQQQRVALARALVADAKYILFDEPLSNVDAKVREHLRAELSDLQKQIGFAGLYVTHDQLEALQLGSRVAVMKAGRIVQLGTPQEVYQQPTSSYVANFVGTVNEFSSKITSIDADCVEVHAPMGRTVVRRSPNEFATGSEILLLCRPEAVRILEETRDLPSDNAWQGRIISAIFSGASNDYIIRAGDAELKCSEAGPTRGVGDEVNIHVPADAWRLIPRDENDNERERDS